MNNIFLCYRRDDQPGYVGRLADGLTEAFGKVVFRDVDSIRGGSKWQTELQKQIGQAEVLIAVIGPKWQSILARREPDGDQVRFELNHARKLGIPVIPVCLQDTQFDYEQDLGSLNWLRELQSFELSDRQGRWHADLNSLVECIAGSTSLERLNPCQSKPAESSHGVSRQAISILAYLPNYLKDFGATLTRPKRHLIRKNTQVDEAYPDSLMFILVSFLLAVILMASRPFYLQSSLWTFIAQQAVVGVTMISLNLAALIIAWRLAGGKASNMELFVTSAYIIGVSSVLMSLVTLLAEGVVRIFDPDFYAMIKESRGVFLENPPRSRLGGVEFLINAVGYSLIGIWCLVAWGAFRRLQGLRRWRSAGALVVFGALFIVAVGIAFFLGSAFSVNTTSAPHLLLPQSKTSVAEHPGVKKAYDRMGRVLARIQAGEDGQVMVDGNAVDPKLTGYYDEYLRIAEYLRANPGDIEGAYESVWENGGGGRVFIDDTQAFEAVVSFFFHEWELARGARSP